MKLYGYYRDGELTYISPDKELLQEICMDEYFDGAYHNWIYHNFIYPETYARLKIKNPPDFTYIPPYKWWKEWEEPFCSWNFDVIDLEEMVIE